MLKWDKPKHSEIILDHLPHILEKLGEWLGDHFDVPVHLYSHSEIVEFGTEPTQPQAPCIILNGPGIDKSLYMGNMDQTFDVGTDGIGRVQTRRYGMIKWKDLSFDYTIVTNGVLDLAKMMESSVILFTDNAYIVVDNRRYKVWETSEPSTFQLVNHTNVDMARGQFQIRGVPFGSPYSYLSSGRVYSKHIRFQVESEIIQESPL